MQPDATRQSDTFNPYSVESIPVPLRLPVLIASGLRQILARLGADLAAMESLAQRQREMQRRLFRDAVNNLPHTERLRLGIGRLDGP